MRKSSIITLWLILLSQAGASVITFEAPPMGTTPQVNYTEGNFYTESEFEFSLTSVPPTSGNIIRMNQSLNSWAPNNGGTHMGAAISALAYFQHTAGMSFSLTQLDLAEYSIASAPPGLIVPIMGYYAAGGTVSRSISLDGIRDGSGAQADFQTFGFSDDWTFLNRVEVGTPGVAFDNIHVTVIPELDTGACLFMGILALMGLKTFQRRLSLDARP